MALVRIVIISRFVQALAVLALLLSPSAGTTAAEATPRAHGPGDSSPELYAPLLPEFRERAFAQTAGQLSRYDVSAVFSPATNEDARLTGTLNLKFVNQTGQEQQSLYFRLYPNSAEYGSAQLDITDAQVAGTPVSIALDSDDTVATLPLPTPLANGDALDIQLQFTTTIPTNPTRTYGMFGYDRVNGTYALAHWLPLLAGFDRETGWNLQPVSIHGDPVFTNTALFDVRLTVPSDLVVVATGEEISARKTLPGMTQRHFVSGPVRDFVLVIDDDFQSDSLPVGGTTVRSWFNPGSASGGMNVMLWGAQSLAVFNRLFGPYPYTELDLVQVDLGNGAAGVEFPQILFIGGDHYASDAYTRRIPDFLEFVVAHEVAHQWWYGLVGNNQYLHAFLDEGLTNYVATVYFEQEYGPERYAYQVNINLKLPYLAMLFAGEGDSIVDQPTDSFPSQNVYGTMVYAKAALGFAAIRSAVGDPAFFSGLEAYAAAFAFSFAIATPDDLRHALEQASGQDLTELWSHWFEAAEGLQDFSPDDLTQLRRDLGD